MANNKIPKFRIYPSIGVARLGNGPAEKDKVIFSPETPWENLYDANVDYLIDGKIKKQAQRFYIYECDDEGKPTHKISAQEYEIEWSVEVANKKPFWYVFNNCLDLSVVSDNLNLSPTFVDREIAPGISAGRRNPNVLDHQSDNGTKYNFRKELINRPSAQSVGLINKHLELKKTLSGRFPFTDVVSGQNAPKASMLAQSMNANQQSVDLGTIEYEPEKGSMIFYGADGKSAALNPSDLNTDFADNSNWYDDICDGRVTAVIKKDGKVIATLNDPEAAAWIVTAPPDYAPQIQPISTMYDLICGTEGIKSNKKPTTDMSQVFPMLYRLYRMQWVNLGDFLASSFRETIDQIIAAGKFKDLYTNASEGQSTRQQVFELFRNPAYPYNNEPIIPSQDHTGIENRGAGTQPLQQPYYPGDGIDYPGSPAQWFAIPPILYDQLELWAKGDFDTLKFEGIEDPTNMDALGKYFQGCYWSAAQDETKQPLLMTRAVLETLYGGGFHPGVELTWPMRHRQLYAENNVVFDEVIPDNQFFGLREIRVNADQNGSKSAHFFKDFGFQINADDVKNSMDVGSKNHWLWEITPGDLTKWMGIPWQSDAGSCQAVFTNEQYPTPAWWAANLPVDVLTHNTFKEMHKDGVLPDTIRNLFANRLAWLHTADTGYVGYHAEGGYTNGLINMVYKWKNVGVVTARKLDLSEEDGKGLPDIAYVAMYENSAPDA